MATRWPEELKLDTAKMGLWPGGFLFMRVEQLYGDSVNARSGALLPVNVNSILPAPGQEGVTIPHLYFTQFLSENVAIVVGKLDTGASDSNEFAHVVGDDRFLGSAFSFNPVVAVTAPYSPLGAALIVLPIKTLQLQFSAFDGDGVPDRSGFDTVFNGKTTYAGEAKLTTNFFKLPGHQTLGGAYGHGSYANFEQDLIVFIPKSGVTPVRSENSWAIYYNFDQYLWNLPGDSTRGVGIFGRLGFADETTSPIAQFYSFGVGGKGVFPDRPHDRFGLGYYYMKTSRDLPAFLHLGNEQGFEAFIIWRSPPAFMLTADLQIVDSAKEGNCYGRDRGTTLHFTFLKLRSY